MVRVAGWLVGGFVLLISAWLVVIRAQGPSTALWLSFSSQRSGSNDLYQIHVSGQGLRQLTTHPAVDTFPSWSPDGRTILFSSDREGFYRLYKLDPRHLTLTHLQQPYFDNWAGSWSPDGADIVFVSRQSDGTSDLFVMPSTGGYSRQLTDLALVARAPAWSPDGEWILFGSGLAAESKLYLVPAMGGTPQRLTDHAGGHEHLGTWSPDGKWITYLAIIDDLPQYIYRIPSAGGTPQRLTEQVAQDWPPVWSPDGRWIAFVAASTPDGNFDIYRIRSDGTGTSTRLTSHPAYDGAPTWSPLYDKNWHAGLLLGAGGIWLIGQMLWARWRRR